MDATFSCHRGHEWTQPCVLTGGVSGQRGITINEGGTWLVPYPSPCPVCGGHAISFSGGALYFRACGYTLAECEATLTDEQRALFFQYA